MQLELWGLIAIDQEYNFWHFESLWHIRNCILHIAYAYHPSPSKRCPFVSSRRQLIALLLKFPLPTFQLMPCRSSLASKSILMLTIVGGHNGHNGNKKSTPAHGGLWNRKSHNLFKWINFSHRKKHRGRPFQNPFFAVAPLKMFVVHALYGIQSVNDWII